MLKYVKLTLANTCSEQIFLIEKMIQVIIGIDNPERNIIDFYKNYVPIKTKYAIHSTTESLYKPTCDLLKRIVKNSSNNTVKCNKILKDDNN